jgi:hypothetical protein
MGELFLRVRAEVGRLPQDRVLRAIELPEDLEDRRVAGDPMSVGPIPIRLSRWISFAAILGISVLMLSVLAFVALRLLPGWRIRRGDLKAKRRVELRFYDLLSDPAASSAKSFPVTGSAFSNFDGQVRLTLGSETMVIGKLRLARFDVPGHPRARLVYRWLGEKKDQEIQLTAGTGPKVLKIEAAITGRPVAELIEI